MALIPTPSRRGTILEVTPPTPVPWEPQPRVGTILEVDPSPPAPVRRGYRGIGLVRGSRG